jgi:uncharacterized OsmC-like protein
MATLPEYLRVKRQRLEEFRTALRVAGAPAVPLSVTARVAGGSGARPVRVREFTIVTDALPPLAGNNLGPTAPELLLSALASCLAHSYVVRAADLGLDFETLEIEVRGVIDYRGTLEVDPDATIPPHQITYEARIGTDAAPEVLEQVRLAVERTCPVLQALLRPMAVTGGVTRAE